jgi:hypothetical protein
MGIAYKDLKVGSFYKGYHLPAPTGIKCFYFVTQNSYSPGQTIPVVVEVVSIFRHQTTTTWSAVFLVGGLPDEESLMKQEVRMGALVAENVGPPLQYTQRQVRPSAAPSVAPAPPPVYAPTFRIHIPRNPSSDSEAAAKAKAERNKGKVVIPENAHSPRCVKCHGANKSIALFQFNSYYCEQCEPT